MNDNQQIFDLSSHPWHVFVLDDPILFFTNCECAQESANFLIQESHATSLSNNKAPIHPQDVSVKNVESGETYRALGTGRNWLQVWRRALA